MIHITAADYKVMPWANGKGSTTELWRRDRDGAMLVRLSRAAVVEDGPFSLFPGIRRNLTVITGPGFDLVGDGVLLAARPLQPIAFPGDLILRATGVTAASDDFNVMVSTRLPPPVVTVEPTAGQIAAPRDGLICLYALAPTTIARHVVTPGELVLSEEPLDKGRGLALVVLISGCGGQILNQP